MDAGHSCHEKGISSPTHWKVSQLLGSQGRLKSLLWVLSQNGFCKEMPWLVLRVSQENYSGGHNLCSRKEGPGGFLETDEVGRLFCCLSPKIEVWCAYIENLNGILYNFYDLPKSLSKRKIYVQSISLGPHFKEVQIRKPKLRILIIHLF